MERQIKPCPFCGCIPEVKESCVNFGEYSINGFRISCECGVETKTKIYEYDGHSEDELKTKVIGIWNKRADGWISVKDRLPEKTEFDWVLVKVRMNPEGYYGVPHIAELRDGEWYSNVLDEPMEIGLSIIVTHWMPLPEPHK